MRSIILRSATRYLFPIIALFSVFLLLRGHDEPGGGFIGGLLGAMCFVLYAIAYDVPTARRMLRLEEHRLIGIGLLLAVGAGVIGLFTGEPFLTSYWFEGTDIPLLGTFKVGSPLIFDVGVYLLVVGVVVMIVFALAEE
jgi:multicomponent Na+:H+ antiporter subunit B